MGFTSGGGQPSVSDTVPNAPNFGDRLLTNLENRLPMHQLLFPHSGATQTSPDEAVGMTPPPPGQSMPELPDLISMNAKPKSGGGLSTILKLIGI